MSHLLAQVSPLIFTKMVFSVLSYVVCHAFNEA
jgi:hypothetical protein